jgi:allantoin racemase
MAPAGSASTAIVLMPLARTEAHRSMRPESFSRSSIAGTEIVTLTPWIGAEGVDCAFESYLSAVAVMDRVLAYEEPYDAVVLAGFGEHGRDGLQELIEQPVVEICEASAHTAMLVARTYSVVTTLQRSVPAIEDRLKLSGLIDRCASIRANGMSTMEVDADPAGAVRSIVEEARKAVESDHAEAICLGCAGMAGLEDAIRDELGVPVIDGVAAAVALAESLVRLGLRTSKVSTYAAPEAKPIHGWPLSARLGLRSEGTRKLVAGGRG